MNKKRVIEWVKNVFFILFGNFLFAFSTYTLVSPSGIVVGGVTGVGITLERALELKVEYFVLPVNIIILIFGLIVLGKKDGHNEHRKFDPFSRLFRRYQIHSVYS